jgi:hypothetical protein
MVWDHEVAGSNPATPTNQPLGNDPLGRHGRAISSRMLYPTRRRMPDDHTFRDERRDGSHVRAYDLATLTGKHSRAGAELDDALVFEARAAGGRTPPQGKAC